MGELLNYIKFPIGYVITSPSCRARQTAELAFGGWETINHVLLHRGPYNEEDDQHLKSLKKLYLNLPVSAGKNTIVSAHNSVVDAAIFDEMPSGIELPLSAEEGGFFVMEQDGEKLKLVHKFHNFNDFIRVFHERQGM